MFLEMNNSRRYLKYLKYWICSGETLTLNLAKDFYKCFNEEDHILLNFYGSTEVMGDVTFFHCKKNMDDMDSVPIGYPIDNTIIYLLDKSFRPLENGEVGEIFVAGLNLANGYVNNRDANRFVQNPYATSKGIVKFTIDLFKTVI